MVAGNSRRSPHVFAGCLLGGAVGDALGAPVEFMTLEEIRRSFGTAGVSDLAPAYGRVGAITDDTQMTLFTAEALIRYDNRLKGKGIASFTLLARNSYLRWLETQGERPPYPDPYVRNGGLMDRPELRHRRAPGNSCLSALRAGGGGMTEGPINNSKGCGGVMRVAPIGLVARETEGAFREACNAAGITHGHPTGILSAGVLAATICALVGGAGLRAAIGQATHLLRAHPGNEEALTAIRSALKAAERGASSASVAQLGQGWVAEEALAIGLYCALVAADFRSGVLLAVNHGGDSDSTGSIAGALLGVIHGKQAIPPAWLDALEARELIEDLAWDLWRHFGGEYIPLGVPETVHRSIATLADGTQYPIDDEEDPRDEAKYPGY